MSNASALLDERVIIETLASLVRINSITNHEQAIADWMANRLSAMGLRDVTRLPVPESGDTVLGWIDGPADGPTFCLNFHLDTFGVFNGWETDPFIPVIREGRMYGLGVHDMKAGDAVQHPQRSRRVRRHCVEEQHLAERPHRGPPAAELRVAQGPLDEPRQRQHRRRRP